MKPLNYAILKYFTTVEEASVNNVMEDLKDDYKSLRTFNKNEIINALLTADKNDDLEIFYHATEESKAAINSYIKD